MQVEKDNKTSVVQENTVQEPDEDIIIQQARAKLKKRFGSKTRTGGKGTQRRKRKGKPHITKERRDRKELDFMKKIDRINKRINNLTGVYKEAWKAYFDEWQFDFCMELARKDIKKSCPFSMKWLKEYSNDFFNLLTISAGTKLSCINNMARSTSFREKYEVYKGVFTERGLDFLEDCLDELDTLLKKKRYLNKNNDSEDKQKVDVPKCTKLLELSDSEIPSKKELKKAYLKKSLELHPDKHPKETKEYIKKFKEIKKAYKQLVLYYYGTK